MTLSKGEWSQHFALQTKSGLSVRDYCKKHGIQPSRWYYWRSRLETVSSDFLPVIIKDQPKQQALTISLLLSGGTKLVINGIEDSRELSKLVLALQGNAA